MGAKERYFKDFYEKLTENPSLAVVVEGPNSVYSMRKLAGGLPEYKLEGKNVVFEKYSAQFQPLIAPMGTIRGDYLIRYSNPRYNSSAGT